MSRSFSRRDVLRMCTAFGALTLATPLSVDAALDLIQAAEDRGSCPTPTTVMGPFFKKSAPRTPVLRTASDPGLPLSVKGRVSDVGGDDLDGAMIEVWHADHFGRYDIEGYRFRATLVASRVGEYEFDSVMPGHYPDRVAQHVHYLVRAPGHKPLVTQLYFATDQVFEGNPAKNFHRDPLVPSLDVVRPVILTGDPQGVHVSVVFDLCLKRL
jgi:protocatechuate 3,4-dioxygenase beta subunit